MTPSVQFKSGRSVLSAAAAMGLAIGVLPAAGQAQVEFVTGAGVMQAPVVSLRDMPFQTVVRQQFDYSCGSAALATLLRHHYGLTVTEAEVFRDMYARGDQARIRRVGFSLLDMKTYLAGAGLSAEGYRTDLPSLMGVSQPAIALIRVNGYRHFVVLKGAADGRILVGDPALGLKSYGSAEFAQVWDGVIFRIEGGPAGAFNRDEDWARLRRGPVQPMDRASLEGFARELPPIYQLTEVRP